MSQAPTFKDPQAAFQAAIDSGRLSENPKSELFAGNYMYMGTYGNDDQFKNSITRQYLLTPIKINGPRCQRCGEEPTLIVGTEESWRCAHCGYYAANDCAVDWDIE